VVPIKLIHRINYNPGLSIFYYSLLTHHRRCFILYVFPLFWVCKLASPNIKPIAASHCICDKLTKDFLYCLSSLLLGLSPFNWFFKCMLHVLTFVCSICLLRRTISPNFFTPQGGKSTPQRGVGGSTIRLIIYYYNSIYNKRPHIYIYIWGARARQTLWGLLRAQDDILLLCTYSLAPEQSTLHLSINSKQDVGRSWRDYCLYYSPSSRWTFLFNIVIKL
jgi:hypothetical protein